MLVLGCLLSLGPQSLEAAPSNVQVGAEVRILARDAAGSGIDGIAVHVITPDGSEEAIGVTGAAGTVVYVPGAVGEYGLSAMIEGIRHRAPLAVARPPWRWLTGSIGLIAGAALLIAHLRWFRSTRRAA